MHPCLEVQRCKRQPLVTRWLWKRRPLQFGSLPPPNLKPAERASCKGVVWPQAGAFLAAIAALRKCAGAGLRMQKGSSCFSLREADPEQAWPLGNTSLAVSKGYGTAQTAGKQRGETTG